MLNANFFLGRLAEARNSAQFVTEQYDPAFTASLSKSINMIRTLSLWSTWDELNGYWVARMKRGVAVKRREGSPERSTIRSCWRSH